MRPYVLPVAASALLALGVTGCNGLNDQDNTTRDESGEIEEGGDVGAFALQVGDCFDDPSLAAAADESSEVQEVGAVPCDEPHDFQVFAAFDVDDAEEYPGEEAMVDQAETRCLDEFEPFIGIDYAESVYGATYLYPTQESWGVGDREVLCLVGSVDGEKLTGDAEGSAE